MPVFINERLGGEHCTCFTVFGKSVRHCTWALADKLVAKTKLITERDRDRDKETERERENSNSKTLQRL